MIYGPYSTGWRDECARTKRAARGARLGLLLIMAACVATWGAIAHLVAS